MLATRKILVVDDEVAICEVVAEVFADWPDTEIVSVHDGVAAVQQLQRERFALCLTDVNLPGLSGLNVAEAAVHDNTPVLILAGHPDMFAQMTLVGLPHLRKPFRIHELLRESQQAVADAKHNVDRAKAALDLLKTRADALHTATAESHRLLGESMVVSARAEGRSRK